jgi:glycogen operon protein
MSQVTVTAVAAPSRTATEGAFSSARADASITPDTMGRPVLDDHFLLLFNAHHEPVSFTVPDGIDASEWTVVVDTTGAEHDEKALWPTGSTHEVPARSVIALIGTPRPGLA